MDGNVLASNDFQKMYTTVLLMKMCFQRHNRLYNKRKCHSNDVIEDALAWLIAQMNQRMIKMNISS